MWRLSSHLQNNINLATPPPHGYVSTIQIILFLYNLFWKGIFEQERAFNRLVPVGVSQNIECRTDDAKTGLGIRSLVFRANRSFLRAKERIPNLACKCLQLMVWGKVSNTKTIHTRNCSPLSQTYCSKMIHWGIYRPYIYTIYSTV